MVSGSRYGLAAITSRRTQGLSPSARTTVGLARAPSLSFLGNLSPDFCYLKGGDMEPFALSQKLEDLAVEVHEAMQQYPKSEKYRIVLTGERK